MVVLEVPGPYVLEITFDDGVRRRIDMAGVLEKEMSEPRRDPRLFTQASLDPVWETVVWPDGADLAPEFLYEPQKSRKDANGDL